MRLSLVLLLVLSGCARHESLVGTWENDTAISQMGMSGTIHVRWEFRADGTTQQRAELTVMEKKPLVNTTLLEGTYSTQGNTLTVTANHVVLDGPLTGHKDLLAPLPPSIRSISGEFKLESGSLTMPTSSGKPMTLHRVH